MLGFAVQLLMSPAHSILSFSRSANMAVDRAPLLFASELAKLKVVLASGSPRRAELLSRLGVSFVVEKSTFAEDHPKEGLTPAEYCLITAKTKANDVWTRLITTTPDGVDLLIAADSIVAMEDGTILEKAEDPDAAKRMIQQLSGSRHQVITAIVLIARTNGAPLVMEHAEITTVVFDTISPEEVDAYVNVPEAWQGKAGAYGIQDLAASFIPRIEGDYYNVMGLPMNRLWTMIKATINSKACARLQ